MIHTELFLYEVSPISQLEKQFLFSEKTSIEIRELREEKTQYGYLTDISFSFNGGIDNAKLFIF